MWQASNVGVYNNDKVRTLITAPQVIADELNELEDYIEELEGKIQFLVDQLVTVDGGFTFPDGEWWIQTKKDTV